jgi:hypothetical protein
MGERKRPRRKPNTTARAQPPKPHKRLIKIAEWAVGILASVLTIAGFWLNNAPKLSVDASGSVASFSPMGTVFYLSHEGILPIYHVAVAAANLKIDGDNLKVLGPWEFTNVPPGAKADILSPGHKMSLPYAPAFGFTAVHNFSGAQLTIIVRYQSAGVWWRKKTCFRLKL